MDIENPNYIRKTITRQSKSFVLSFIASTLHRTEK